MSSQITALHGMLGSPSDWDSLKTALGPQFPTEAPDLWHKRWRAEFDKIGALINAETTGEILLGYSMGGRLALHALTENPIRWKAAIIISAHPGLIQSERLARILADQVWAQKARTEDWSAFLEDWNAQPLFAETKSPDRTDLEPHREAIAIAFEQWSLARQKNLLPDFPNITTPILWITGAEDQKFTAIAQSACQHLPNAQHTIIPHANHRPQIENPLHFLTSLQTFFLSFNVER